MSPRAASCSPRKLNRLSEQPRNKKKQTGRISLFFEGKFVLMYWECNFRSTCSKEMSTVRNIILTESNIRFKNVIKKFNLLQKKQHNKKLLALFFWFVVLSSLMLVVTATATCHNLL